MVDVTRSHVFRWSADAEFEDVQRVKGTIQHVIGEAKSGRGNCEIISLNH